MGTRMAWNPSYTDTDTDTDTDSGKRTIFMGDWTAEVAEAVTAADEPGATVHYHHHVFSTPLVPTATDQSDDAAAILLTITSTAIRPTEQLQPVLERTDDGHPTTTTTTTTAGAAAGFTPGAIAGIAISAAVPVFGILVFVAYFLCYRRKRHGVYGDDGRDDGGGYNNTSSRKNGDANATTLGVVVRHKSQVTGGVENTRGPSSVAERGGAA